MEAEDRHWERAEQRDVEQWRHVAADQLQISGATFAFTFLHWLSLTKCAPKASTPALDVLNLGT